MKRNNIDDHPNKKGEGKEEKKETAILSLPPLEEDLSTKSWTKTNKSKRKQSKPKSSKQKEESKKEEKKKEKKKEKKVEKKKEKKAEKKNVDEMTYEEISTEINGIKDELAGIICHHEDYIVYYDKLIADAEREGDDEKYESLTNMLSDQQILFNEDLIEYGETKRYARLTARLESLKPEDNDEKHVDPETTIKKFTEGKNDVVNDCVCVISGGIISRVKEELNSHESNQEVKGGFATKDEFSKLETIKSSDVKFPEKPISLNDFYEKFNRASTKKDICMSCFRSDGVLVACLNEAVEIMHVTEEENGKPNEIKKKKKKVTPCNRKWHEECIKKNYQDYHLDHLDNMWDFKERTWVCPSCIESGRGEKERKKALRDRKKSLDGKTQGFVKSAELVSKEITEEIIPTDNLVLDPIVEEKEEEFVPGTDDESTVMKSKIISSHTEEKSINETDDENENENRKKTGNSNNKITRYMTKRKAGEYTDIPNFSRPIGKSQSQSKKPRVIIPEQVPSVPSYIQNGKVFVDISESEASSSNRKQPVSNQGDISNEDIVTEDYNEKDEESERKERIEKLKANPLQREPIFDTDDEYLSLSQYP